MYFPVFDFSHSLASHRRQSFYNLKANAILRITAGHGFLGRSHCPYSAEVRGEQPGEICYQSFQWPKILAFFSMLDITDRARHPGVAHSRKQRQFCGIFYTFNMCLPGRRTSVVRTKILDRNHMWVQKTFP